MLRKLIPVIMVLIGLGAGLGAGIMLRPESEASGDESAPARPTPPAEPPEYATMSNQFIIPVVEQGRVVAMVVMSLGLEVIPGGREAVFAREPKLRDAFLQVLFDHANAGGFRGAFTDGSNLIVLRRALLEVAQKALPDVVQDVLISDILRQDS